MDQASCHGSQQQLRSPPLLFLNTDIPLFADGFFDNSSDISTAESETIGGEEFPIETITADKPDPCAPETSLYHFRWSMFPPYAAPGNQRPVSWNLKQYLTTFPANPKGGVKPFDWKRRARKGLARRQRQ